MNVHIDSAASCAGCSCCRPNSIARVLAQNIGAFVRFGRILFPVCHR